MGRWVFPFIGGNLRSGNGGLCSPPPPPPSCDSPRRFLASHQTKQKARKWRAVVFWSNTAGSASQEGLRALFVLPALRLSVLLVWCVRLFQARDVRPSFSSWGVYFLMYAFFAGASLSSSWSIAHVYLPGADYSYIHQVGFLLCTYVIVRSKYIDATAALLLLSDPISQGLHPHPWDCRVHNKAISLSLEMGCC